MTDFCDEDDQAQWYRIVYLPLVRKALAGDAEAVAILHRMGRVRENTDDETWDAKNEEQWS